MQEPAAVNIEVHEQKKTETIIKKKVSIPLWNTENLREEEGIVEEEVGEKNAEVLSCRLYPTDQGCWL